MPHERNLPSLYHFPTLYEGDCFYDILARYHRESVHLTSRATSQELFGKNPDLRPTIVLPYRAQLINVWLGSESNILPSVLRDRHSAWQYLQLSSEFTESNLTPVIRAEARPGRRKQGRMYAELIGSLNCLRYCPACVIQDIMKWKEPFWHQVHQLYGVQYCPIHHQRLRNSPVRTDKRLAKYITAEDVFMADAPLDVSKLLIEDPSSDQYYRPFLALSKTIDWLLKHGLELGNADQRMQTYARAAGYDCDRALPGNKLVELMTSIGGKSFLAVLWPEGKCDETLNCVLQGAFSALTPLCHALIVLALNLTP